MDIDPLEQQRLAEATGDDAPPAVRALLDRLQHSAGFPALSAAVMRIQQLASSESENLHTLAAEILQDVALTQKLLRLVNTAHFSHAGAGSIGTVSRAVALIGFRGVRDLALSLLLLEHLTDRAQASRLRREYLRALLAAALAGELSRLTRAGEEAFVGTLFQNLGRLLVEYYCPEDAERLRALAPVAAQRDAAALQVLGVTLPQLGLAVARAWDLPPTLQRCMLVPDAELPPRRAAPPGVERMRWLGRAAQEMADVMLGAPSERLPALLQQIALRYAPVLDIGPRDVAAAAERLHAALPQWARALGLESALRQQRKALAAVRMPPPPPAETLVLQPPALAILAAGVQDVTEALLADPVDLDALARTLLEVVWRALGARHAVLCLRDDAGDALVARHALGIDPPSAVRAFRVPLDPAIGDPFARLCVHGADTLIADTRGSDIASRLPRWWREHFNAGTLLLMPLVLQGRPMGLLYADQALANALPVGDREWPLLRTLRNQVLLGLKRV